VIYYYGPFKDDVLQARFEHQVEATAKPGAIIIANRKVSDAWRHSTDFRLLRDDGVMSCILQKQQSGKPDLPCRHDGIESAA